MKEQYKSFCERLSIEYKEELLPYYERGIELYKEKGDFAVDKDRIAKYHAEYNIFRRWYDDVIKACDEVKKDEELMVFVYMLIAVIEVDKDVLKVQMPDRNRMDTDYAPMFSLLYFLEKMIGDMKKRGLSHKIISDTLYGFDTEMNDYYKTYGRSGVRVYVWWFMLYIRGEMIRIGRFQFQFKKMNNKIRCFEKDGDVKVMIDGNYIYRNGMVVGDENYAPDEERVYAEITENGDEVTGYVANQFGDCIEKVTLKGYKEFLRNGDWVISVHIPSGEPLDYDYSMRSYEEAKEIILKNYPEYDFKAFACWSWLCNQHMKEILGKETNITRFADEYVSYPVDSKGDGVYSFLYNLPKRVADKDLPVNSSMQAKVKEFLMAGNLYYEYCGIIKL